ncbi:6-pyruvoyl trahydropterin synthase family protein [Chitinophaga rhizophila]|uniref:6-carboxy-5,6,7,8-tetrahydropterin synthase n=1 Tax=Chitinophaga rhizophila TaxID=2866212 RepID=A0ABS7GA29_9BACT|nr:6-carboxytetrahydropterin synthase [Chitinophaga rhizophila]MBW8683582.1 6-carboxytetrahydropterin synthase [Chitinophaga rhizophila]
MKKIIRITRIFKFEMAHALTGYSGLCRHIHGHSYQLEVTVSGQPIDMPGHNNDGMVLDFSELKSIVQQEVIAPLDHALMLRSGGDTIPATAANSELFGRIVWTSWQPTCENMVVDFAQRISGKLPEGVLLHSLKLYETSNSFAEWYASDNL